MRIRNKFLLAMLVPVSLLVLQVAVVQYLLREQQAAMTFVAVAQRVIEADFAAADLTERLRAEIRRVPSVYNVADRDLAPLTAAWEGLQRELSEIVETPLAAEKRPVTLEPLLAARAELARQYALTQGRLNAGDPNLNELIERAIFTDRAAAALADELARLATELRGALQQAVDDVARLRDRPAVVSLAIGVVAVFLLALFAWLYIDRGLVARLTRLSDSMRAVAGGNLKIDLPAPASSDEIDEMTRALTVFRNTAVEIEEQNLRQIAVANQRIMDSLHYASRIQSALLPSREALGRALAEHFLIWEPRDIVGGDFYWVHDDGEGLFLIIGDCTGHGVPGAFMTLITCGLIDRHLQRLRRPSPALLLERIHRDLYALLGRDRTGTGLDDGLEAGACYLHRGSRELRFAGARFSLWQAGAGELREHRGSKAGIGFRRLGPAIDYGELNVALRPDERFYLTTDGLIDQIGGPRRRSFGRKRFAAQLDRLAMAPLDHQGQALRQEFLTFQGGEPRRDDVTVLGFSPVLH